MFVLSDEPRLEGRENLREMVSAVVPLCTRVGWGEHWTLGVQRSIKNISNHMTLGVSISPLWASFSPAVEK